VALNSFGRAAVSGGKSLAQLKSFFFDRKRVQDAAEKGTVRALSKFGAFVRRAAQTSMRYRKKASPPGQPPSAHKDKRRAALKKLGRAKNNGALLRELLFFAYDPRTRSVVVGPLGFKSKGGVSVPALHEFGGTRTAYPSEKFVAGRGKKARVVSVGGKTLRYPKRPFMAPALDKMLPRFAATFRGSVSR
jgi:hypothetical protein